MPLLSIADEFAEQFDVKKNLTDSALEKLESKDWSMFDPARELKMQTEAVGVIRIFGLLVDRRSFGEWLGCETSYESIADTLLYCQKSGIKNIVLDINSPGGYASGVLNLVQLMHNARDAGCHITAVVNTLCCSAAYRIACACDEIIALPEAIVGSIGVNYIMMDSHRQASMRGLDPVVISTSDYKWMGTPGTPITDKQKENIRVNMVEPFYQTFSEEVQAARKLTNKELEAVADGRTFRAEQALELKLIDKISTFADALEAVGVTQKIGEIQMAKEKTPEITETTESAKPVEASVPAVETPTAATLAQLDEKFPHATAEFKLGQLRQNATLDAAKDAYIAQLEQQLVVAQAAVKTAPEPKKEPEPEPPAKMTLPGSSPVEKTENVMPTTQTEETAMDRLKKIISEKEQAGLSQSEAAAEAFRENPELRQEWIKGVNAK